MIKSPDRTECAGSVMQQTHAHTTRRQFLRGAAAGIAFCGCGWPAVTAAQPAQAARRPVTVNGKQIKTIDVHSHCLFHEATALLGDDANRIGMGGRGGKDLYIDLDARLKAMDSQAIDMEVLSINPYWYGRDRDFAAKIVQIQNEKLAEFVATHRDRFAAFASLTLQDPQLAVRELETAVKQQGLRGAAIGGRVAGAPFSDPKFHPVWQKADELGAVLFIHPLGLPELEQLLSGNGFLRNVVGNPLETTIALQHLIFEGTLDRFPGLKIIAAHGGGYLPSYAARSDFGCITGERFCSKEIVLKKKPSEYLRGLYFDSLLFTPEALRHLAAEVGVSQVMLGSDLPFPWQAHPVDHVLATSTLSDDEKIAILGGNAAKLLNL